MDKPPTTPGDPRRRPSSTARAAGGFEADVAVKDGRIAAVGQVAGAGRRGDRRARPAGRRRASSTSTPTTTARPPGTSGMQPSSWHGVTTVVMGNCGVGFAPCRPRRPRPADPADGGRRGHPLPGADRGPAVELGELSRLSRQPGRAPVRRRHRQPAAARGAAGLRDGRARASNREPATAGRHRTPWPRIAKRAMEAGALGFTTSRTLNHRTSDGSPIATLTAGEDELTGIAWAWRRPGKGVLQVVSDFADRGPSSPCCGGSSSASGRPLSFSLLQSPIAARQLRDSAGTLEDAAKAAGLPIKAQVAARPVGVLFGLELTLNPFSHLPDLQGDRQALPLAERVARLRDPEFRARLLADDRRNGRRARPAPRGLGAACYPAGRRARTTSRRRTPRSPPSPSARGVDPGDVALDHMLDGERRARHDLRAAPELRRGHARPGATTMLQPRRRGARACRTAAPTWA